MKRYTNRKSGVTVKVISQDEATNNITVEFVDGKSAGQQVNYKLASFTKSWKFLDEISDIEKEVKEENNDSTKSIVDIEEKIKLMSDKILSSGYDIKIYSDRVRNLNVKKGKSLIAEICLKHNRIVIYSKQVLSSDSQPVNNGKKYKTFVEYSDNFYNEVMNLIEGK